MKFLKAVEKALTRKTVEICSCKWERFNAELAAARFRFASGEDLQQAQCGRFVYLIVLCHHFARTSLPFCGVRKLARRDGKPDTSAMFGGMPGASGLKIALLGQA